VDDNGNVVIGKTDGKSGGLVFSPLDKDPERFPDELLGKGASFYGPDGAKAFCSPLFFLFGNLHGSVNRVLEDYVRILAATAPDPATARNLSERLNLQVRYEGPTGGWTTADDLPRVDDVRQGRVPQRNREFLHRSYYVVAAPNGGTYLFAWSLADRMSGTHSALVGLLLLVMAAVIVVAYAVLNRLLRPLRKLSEGVARLSAGELDVVLPVETRDEFGRLTEAFNHMVDRVRAMIGARDQLLQDVSHELRSPVTRMKVALELLPAGVQRTGMADDLTEMERKIAELLEMERLRCGRGLEIVRQDLLPLLREVAGDFQERHPGVTVTASALEMFVEIDAEKIRTVLRNLLENAAKYSLPHSRPVEISATQDGDSTIVRVTDDGPGIPESEADRVFEPFFRADRSRSKDTGGYGLGLSICKRVMQAHGGDIAYEKGRSTGASFILTFANKAKAAGSGHGK
jgi:signal transduction histidine kinase